MCWETECAHIRVHLPQTLLAHVLLLAMARSQAVSGCHELTSAKSLTKLKFCLMDECAKKAGQGFRAIEWAIGGKIFESWNWNHQVPKMILSQIHTVSDSQSGRAHLHRSPMAPHIPFAPMARQASHMPPKLQNWKPKWDWLLLGSMEVWEPLVHCAWFAHTHVYTYNYMFI